MTQQTPPYSILEKLFGPFEPGGIRPVWSPALTVDNYSEYVQLLKRHLYLFEPIQDAVDVEPVENGTSYLLKALNMLNEISDEPITLFINSPGGGIPDGMALIQAMRDSKAPVNTFVAGEAASMAAVVAVAGVKRYAYPAAQWLLHRGKFKSEGDYEDLHISAKKARLDDVTADQVILNFTKIPAAKLDRMQRKDKWLGVEDALKHGLVDEIVLPLRSPTQDWKSWLPDRTRLKAKDEADNAEPAGE